MSPPPRLQASPNVVYSQVSGTSPTTASVAIPMLFQIGSDGSVQLQSFCGLLAQNRGESAHLLFKLFTIILGFFGPDISAWREYMTVLTNSIQFGGFAKSRNIGIHRRILVTSPRMVRSGDFRHVIVAKLTVHSVDQRSKLTGIDEERFSSAVAESAVLLVASEEPEAHGNLC